MRFPKKQTENQGFKYWFIWEEAERTHNLISPSSFPLIICPSLKERTRKPRKLTASAHVRQPCWAGELL
jgi:hypothetical protein